MIIKVMKNYFILQILIVSSFFLWKPSYEKTQQNFFQLKFFEKINEIRSGLKYKIVLITFITNSTYFKTLIV
jgi:hypothetical protein